MNGYANPLQQNRSHLVTWELVFQVIENKSIIRVAEQHRISRSDLSRRISSLELELNRKLFERKGKLIEPTLFALEAQKRLAPSIVSFNKAFNTMFVQDDFPEGIIRLGSMPGFMQGQIVPHLIEFQQNYPKISFDVFTDNDPENWLNGQADVCFCYGPTGKLNLLEYWVTDAIFISCASPRYLSIYGTPKHPNDLFRHAGVLFCGKQRERAEFLEYHNEKIRCKWHSTIRFNNILSVKAAAIEGGGIAIDIPLHHCYQELMEGKLVPIFKKWHLPRHQNYVCIAREASRLKRVQLFVDWYIPHRRTLEQNQKREIQKKFGIEFPN
jgi:putative transcriptional regulator, lysR family